MGEQKDNKLQIVRQINEVSQVFSAGSTVSFVFNKIKKLASAIYLVTNSWTDMEPLKWSLRQKSLCLLEKMIDLEGENTDSANAALTHLSCGLSEILSELEISFTAGFVSEMNMRILKTEYQNLLSFLKSNNLASVYLPPSFFEVGQITDNPQKDFLAKSLPSTPTGTVPKGHKRHLKDKEMSFRNNNAKSVVAHNSKQEINHDRRGTILKIIKNKGEISVKDVSAVIKGFSEKTIQRELLSMADEGILKKSGERRWSRYSLAK